VLGPRRTGTSGAQPNATRLFSSPHESHRSKLQRTRAFAGRTTRRTQASRFCAAGDYVFASGRGTPLGHRNVERRALARAAERAGINREGAPPLRFHDLRHTFASHLIIDLRLDVAQVSRILGHASTSITLDTYTQTAHTADLRAQLGRSEFVSLQRPFIDGSGCTRSPERRRPGASRRHHPAPRARPRTLAPPTCGRDEKRPIRFCRRA
jgi:hypothetical protein